MHSATPLTLALALALTGACGRDHAEERTVREARTRRVDANAVVAESASGARTATGPAAPGAKPSCPATGLWALCSVIERLDRQGLAPRRDSGDVRVAPLTQPGVRVNVGAAELDLFLYADAAARERDERRLDKDRYIEATAAPTLRGEATLIRSANLLAILRSRNDHQRERVSDALTAGPPQAATAVPIAGTTTRK